MVKKKVLIIDDEPDFLKMMKLRLETLKYDVVTASSGREGLEKAASEDPDAILLDIMMPDIDGLTVLKSIRKSSPDLPVFILTAYSNDELKKAERELDATGLIIKTQDMTKEVKKISTAIDVAVKYRGRTF
ncbi:MAG TPA: response regulator [Candidatus Omnitrophota bacterium]|nr:response regulator [Candidatus Omnitrophota bacterium]